MIVDKKLKSGEYLKKIEVELRSYRYGKFFLDVTMYECNDEIIFKDPIKTIVSVSNKEGNYTTNILSIEAGSPKIKDLVLIRDIAVNYAKEFKPKDSYMVV